MSRLVLLLSLCLAISCQQRKQAQSDLTASASIPFTTVKEGVNSGVSEAGQMWIKDIDAWKECWKNVHANTYQPPALPEVDFATKQLLACFMGTRNSGGYKVSIDKLGLRSGELELGIIHELPGKGCMTTMALTSPYIIIAIDRQEARTIIYEIEEKEYDCNR